MNRERKKIRKELAAAEESMRQRLSLSDQSAAEPGKRLSPRLPRRYSTPQVLLTASLPARTLHAEKEKYLPGNRRRIDSDKTIEVLGKSESPSISPTSSQFLTAPFNQPRRRSLPPIGGGSLTGADCASSKSPLMTRRDSSDGRRSRGSLTPNVSSSTLQRRESPAVEGEMSVEVAVKVSQFLQKIGQGKVKDGAKHDAVNPSKIDGAFSSDDGEEDSFLHPLTVEPVKRPSIFQPSHFE